VSTVGFTNSIMRSTLNFLLGKIQNNFPY
jgi:hypothetical protein